MLSTTLPNWSRYSLQVFHKLWVFSETLPKWSDFQRFVGDLENWVEGLKLVEVEYQLVLGNNSKWYKTLIKT